MTGQARRGKRVLGKQSEEAGQVLYGYQSRWLSASLLRGDGQAALGRCAARSGGAALERNAARQQGSRRRSPEAITARGTQRPIRRCLTPLPLRSAPPKGRRRTRDCRVMSPTLRWPALRATAIDAAMKEVRRLVPRRVIRLGERFLRGGVAGRLLGRELRQAPRRQGSVRSRRPVLCASRCGQRTLER